MERVGQTEKKTRNKWRKRDLSVNLVFIVVVTVSFSLLCSCYFMFRGTILQTPLHKTCDSRWLQLRDSIYQSGVVADSIFRTKAPSKTPSKGKNEKENTLAKDDYIFTRNDFEMVREMQKEIIRRQDILTDDLRQETNNVINKVNGWLAFWMGIMAILGVFVPIALQFKLYRETRDREEEGKTKLEKAIRGGRIMLNKSKELWDKEIAKTKEVAKKDIKKEMESLVRVKFTTLIRTFHALSECSGLKVTVKRDELIERSLKEVINQFTNLVERYMEFPQDGEMVYHLCVAIVQVTSVLSLIKQFIPRRVRKVDYLITESYHLIDALNTPGTDCDTLHSRLRTYCKDLSLVTIR